MKKKLVVITGAGVSAESGISTFRGNGGLWNDMDVMTVASHTGWVRNHELVLEFYNQRRKDLKNARPNAAHKAIADLEKDYSVTVVTQNVDNLHERAGSTKIIHIHGELTKVRPDQGTYDRTFSEAEVFDIGYEEVHVGDLAPNGSQLRPHIVFFEESVPKIEKAIEAVEAADILLIVGTSMQVYPAAALYSYAKASTPITVIDPADVPVRDSRIRHIREVATKGMEIFTESLRSQNAENEE